MGFTEYAHDHGYTNLKILVDDGYTGTNFNRPGVQEGFALVKQGLVGCWLVKDLSRFGRDYLTVGQYTDIFIISRMYEDFVLGELSKDRYKNNL